MAIRDTEIRNSNIETRNNNAKARRMNKMRIIKTEEARLRPWFVLNFEHSNFDAFVKSRHPGENRGPEEF